MYLATTTIPTKENLTLLQQLQYIPMNVHNSYLRHSVNYQNITKVSFTTLSYQNMPFSRERGHKKNKKVEEAKDAMRRVTAENLRLQRELQKLQTEIKYSVPLHVHQQSVEQLRQIERQQASRENSGQSRSVSITPSLSRRNSFSRKKKKKSFWAKRMGKSKRMDAMNQAVISSYCFGAVQRSNSMIPGNV